MTVPPPFRLGSHAFAPPLLLAPMAGFTDAAMRRISHRFSAALTYTEMVNATGLTHASDKSWHLLETLDGEGPVVAHLYGGKPEEFAAAAERVAATGRFVAIDVNAGCPVRKIAAKGAGATLMRDPPRLGRIVAAIRGACALPVTVKTRVGPCHGEVRIFEILDQVQAAGAAAITVHARYATQGHTGPVHLDLLAEVKRRASIPVVGNGGLAAPGDVRRMREATGVDAVMIGRAAMGNPWVFAAMAADLRGETAPDRPTRPSTDDIRAVLRAHIDDAIELRRRIAARYRLPDGALGAEEAAILSFRCQFFRYLAGLKGASFVRGRLHTLHTRAGVEALVDGCLDREAAYRGRLTTPAPAAP